ncbi:MAG: ATP-binding protein [Candidatus Sericytochromatia bacterium]
MYRLKNEIKNTLNKSNNVIFLYGNNIDDYFYNDFNLGTLSLKDSLYYFFRKEYKTEYSYYIDGEFNLNCFNKKSYRFLDDYFKNKEKIEDSDITQYTITTNNKKNKRNEKLSELNNFFSTSKEKRLLIIDSFEWLAELFNFNMHNTEIIKLISKWNSLYEPNFFVIVLVKSVEILENYYFDINKDNFINIPMATSEEYFSSFYRYIFKNTNFYINFEKLNNISTAFKSNNFNLKQALNIFIKEFKAISDISIVEPLAKIEEISYDYEKLDIKLNKYFNTPIEEKIDFDTELILDKKIKERIKIEFKNFIENKPYAKKGIILTGPSGTGKTLIAKSIASMAGFNFLPLKLSDLKQLYVGHSGAEVKKIFDKARAMEPTIVFIDEIDSVFTKRTDLSTDSFAKDITNEFIAQVDGVDNGKQRVFIIGATNIPETIDSAVISRFDMQIVPLPSKLEREKLFELYIPELEEFNWFKINKHTFLEKTEGLSGRDIKEICNTIKNIIYDSNNKNLNKDIIDYSLDVFKEKVISSSKDKFSYLSAKKNFTNFNNIIGYEEIKDEIKNSVVSVLKAAELRLFNIEAERGILLEGPPGNGKSFIAQSIAGEFHLDFIKIISKDISSSFYAEDAKKLSDIFDSAFKIARLSKNGCLLFFDEFDGIASKHSNLNLRATMLDFIVKSRTIPNFILMAATNYKELLDEATIRDGRFDKKITINNPTKENILSIIKEFLKEFDKVSNKNKIENRITSETYNKILDYIFKQENTSKSISGIKVFCNNLKKKAFFKRKITKDKVLIIDDEIVLEQI